MTNQELKQLCENITCQYTGTVSFNPFKLATECLRLLAENEKMRVVCEAAQDIVTHWLPDTEGNVYRIGEVRHGMKLEQALSQLPPEAGDE